MRSTENRRGLFVTIPHCKPESVNCSSNTSIPGKKTGCRVKTVAYKSRYSIRIASKLACCGVKPKPNSSKPREPCDATGLILSSASGGNPCFLRCKLSAMPRSCAVSTKVPSRSNNTVEIMSFGYKSYNLLRCHFLNYTF